jgi:Protein of unknown function (DUF3592)
MTLTILSVIGAALVTLGAVLASREHAWLQKAQFGPGKVIELVMRTGNKGRPTYTPRVQYTAPDGSIHDFTRGFGSNPVGFTSGQNVQVAYDPMTFEGRILTFGQRFGFAAVLIIVGFSLILIKVTFTYGDRLLPRIYAAQMTDHATTRTR